MPLNVPDSPSISLQVPLTPVAVKFPLNVATPVFVTPNCTAPLFVTEPERLFEIPFTVDRAVPVKLPADVTCTVNVPRAPWLPVKVPA